jgi:hypothetical protein
MATAKKAQENEGSIAARAWNATKEDGDPHYDLIPNAEFKAKREHDVDRVRATGIAQTNFEIEAKKLIEAENEENKGEGPMAVAAPAPALGGTAPMSAPVTEAPEGNQKTSPKGSQKNAAVAQKSQGGASKSKGKGAAKGKGKTQSAASKAKASSKKAAKKTDQSGHVPTGEEADAIVAAEKDAPLRP